MRKIAGYLTKNRSGKDQKIAQSTHENEYIKPRKTFWRNSKQFLTYFSKDQGLFLLHYLHYLKTCQYLLQLQYLVEFQHL
ncbi:hypothetical protein EVD32_10395 [Bacteroidales bacterium SW299]|nr:hypothetical protein [Bacteroidales bacterium SW299]